VAVHDQKKRDKRTRIIEAAARVFAQKGFASTTIAEIATQAEIGKGTVYEYFKSKEDLFFAVFERYIEETKAGITVSISALTGSASERLDAMCLSAMATAVEMKHQYSLAMEFWAASASSKMRDRFKQVFRQAYADFRGIVSTLIQDGIKTGEFRSDVDADSVAAALVGALDALGLQAWFDDTFDPLNTTKSFMAVLTQGLVK
jgi:AcrR family transcriptional regulator